MGLGRASTVTYDRHPILRQEAASLIDGEGPDAVDPSRTDLETLLVRVADADRGAFEEVYRRTAARLFAECRRIIFRRQEAEEALQEAYLSLWQRAGRFDPARGSAMAWLVVIARHAAVDRLRVDRARPALPETGAERHAPDPAPLAIDAMVSDEEVLQLRGELDRLDPIDAGFLREAFLYGVTYSALAERARLPLGTVKSRIRRALLTLRGRMP